MIKLETHCHTLYGSHCGLADAKTIIDRYSKAGYGGIVITNHFNRREFATYKGETNKEKIDFYFSLFDEVKKLGEDKGIKVFLGAEINASTNEEYVLYGFDESLFYRDKLMFEFSQEELFELSEKNGCFLYQSHPFRPSVPKLGNPDFLHGAEYFNGHYHHINNNAKAREWCDKNKLIGLSGTDFHTPDQPITAGVFIPDEVDNEKSLVECLFKGNFSLYCDEITYEVELEKFLERKNKCK